ncbi:MAG: archease [bacterium]
MPFRFLEDIATADIAFEAWGETMEELFSACAEAVIGIMADDANTRDEEIREVKPDFAVLMGKIAWKTPRLAGIEYIETYHPAAAMRFPGARKRFEEISGN